MARRKVHPNDPTSSRSLTALQREEQAVDLRKTGLSYRQIAEVMNISHVAVGDAIKRAIKKTREAAMDDAADIVELELQRLDELLTICWPLARKGDLFAIDRVLKISERRSKLLGLDAATKTEITGAGGGPIGVLAIPTTATVGEWVEIVDQANTAETEAAERLLDAPPDEDA